MGNCLVTKLKESVNNNLPKLGKVTLYIPTGTANVIVVKAGNNPCNVVFNNCTCSIPATRQTGVSSVTVPSNSFYQCNIEDVSHDNMSIDIDAYNCRGINAISIENVTGLDSALVGTLAWVEFRTNRSFATNFYKNYKNDDMIVYSPELDTLSSEERVSMLLKSKDTLKSAYSSHMTVENACEFSQLQECLIDSGNLSELPTTFRRIRLAYSQLITGSLTTLAAKYKNAGITEGKIHIPWLGNPAHLNITIDDGNGNEIPVTTYMSNNHISQSNNVYLYWTTNSVGVTNDGSNVLPCIDVGIQTC